MGLGSAQSSIIILEPHGKLLLFSFMTHGFNDVFTSPPIPSNR